MVREARHDEAVFITEMVRLMVFDMERYSGHAPASEQNAWDQLAGCIAEELGRDNIKYLIAEAVDREPIGVVGAKIVTLGGAFAPKKTMHVSVVYVLPKFRRAGVASKLMSRALDWGRIEGAECCILNVLAENPAKSLYEKHGFSGVEIEMRKPLSWS
jgi:ribosomal protein S18 acetylase RimI-like enzyme